MKKKIAFCINSLNIGGAESLIIDLINNWDEDHEVHLILFSETNDLIRYIHPNKVFHTEFIMAKKNLGKIYQVNKYFKRNEIKYCFSHLERPNKVCSLASLFSRTQNITVIHNMNIYKDTFPKLIASLIYKYISPKSVVISDAVYEYCKNELKTPISKLIKINNGVDFRRIDTGDNVRSLSNHKSFAVLGRMEKVKGYDILIEALNDNKLKSKNWSLILIGGGSQLTDLQSKVHQYGLSEKIKFLGPKIKPFENLMNIHYLVMPSRREGLPISLIESLSFGIPVIASDIGMLPKIIENELNGFVFPSENKKALIGSLTIAIEQNVDQYAKMALEAKKTSQKFAIDACVIKYLNLTKA